VTTLDDEITQILGLIGLLLVFVVGYFTALLPQIDEWLGREAPAVQADRKALVRRLGAFRKLAVGFLLADVLLLALLTPVSRRIVLDWSFEGPFPTLRAGLLLIDLFLVVILVSGAILLSRLWRRIQELKK
jgi:uncharacterized membrane protein YhhN